MAQTFLSYTPADKLRSNKAARSYSHFPVPPFCAIASLGCSFNKEREGSRKTSGGRGQKEAAGESRRAAGMKSIEARTIPRALVMPLLAARTLGRRTIYRIPRVFARRGQLSLSRRVQFSLVSLRAARRYKVSRARAGGGGEEEKFPPEDGAAAAANKHHRCCCCCC